MPSLQNLVDVLGPHLLEVPAAPKGLEVSYTRLLIYDVLEDPEVRSQDLVLGVGLAADAALSLRVLRAQPAALLLRHDGRVSQGLVTEAESNGAAVLIAPAVASWSQLHDIALSLAEPKEALLEYSAPGSQIVEDLFSFASVIAESVEAPVTIEDTQSRLLAYSAKHEGADEARSATILGHRVPDSFRREVRRLGIAKRLLTETEPFFVASPIDGIRSRTVVALRARGEVLGSIWAMTEKPLDEQRNAALKQAAASVAVRLLHHRLTADLQRQRQAAMLERMLAGGPDAADAARRSGLSGAAFRLIAVAATSGIEPENSALLDMCWSGLSMQLSLVQELGLTGRLEDRVYAVVACPNAGDRGLVMAKKAAAASLGALPPGLRDRVVAGVSGPVETLTDLPDAREEVDRVVTMAIGGSASDQIASAEELGVRITLARLADLEERRRAGRQSVLDQIDAYDADHSSSYGRTLQVYLSAFGDPAITAKSLGVHTNTLRYRLRRLTELFGLDLADEDARFELLLEQRLRRL